MWKKMQDDTDDMAGIGDRNERVFDYEYPKRTYGIERIQRIILSEMGG